MQQYEVKAPASEAQIATMFDKIAARYDFLNHLLSAGQDLRWRKALLQAVPLRTNSFLDLATGTGDVVIALAERQMTAERFIPAERQMAAAHHPAETPEANTGKTTLVGGDISENMLSLAREKSAKLPKHLQPEFLKINAEKIPFTDSSFECITISFGLRNVVNKPEALKEFMRVLKPGGRLLILEFFLPQSTFLSRLFMFYFHRVLPFIAGLFSDKSAYQYLPQSVGSFYTLAELDKILEGLSFSSALKKEFLFGTVKLLGYDKASK